MLRKYEAQKTHDALVEMMVNHFAYLGYSDICADIPGYRRPNDIYWTNSPDVRYRPDLTCKKNDAQQTLIILEAETCETLESDHTEEQFRLFRANTNQNKGEFHIVVPRSCSGRPGGDFVNEVIRRLRISVDSIWWPSE